MESMTCQKCPGAEAGIKTKKKISSVCTVTNEAIYSFKKNMCTIGVSMGSYSFFCMACVSHKTPITLQHTAICSSEAHVQQSTCHCSQLVSQIYYYRPSELVSILGRGVSLRLLK